MTSHFRTRLVRTLKPGDSITLDNGRIRLEAIQVPGRRVSLKLELPPEVVIDTPKPKKDLTTEKVLLG